MSYRYAGAECALARHCFLTDEQPPREQHAPGVIVRGLRYFGGGDGAAHGEDSGLCRSGAVGRLLLACQPNDFVAVPGEAAVPGGEQAGEQEERRRVGDEGAVWKGRDANAALRYLERLLGAHTMVASFGPTAAEKLLLRRPAGGAW